jgi:hypothetical protein
MLARTRNATSSVVAIVYTAIFVGLIYGPVGWSMMGLIEEWDNFYLFAKFGVFYIADAGSPHSEQRIRPLAALPFSVGYLFGPNAFVVLHVLQATSLVFKGLAIAVIIDWLLANRLIAVLCGLIFVVYPADTMQMTLRAVHINCAVALSVGGIALLLDATRREGSTIRLSESIFAGVVFLAGSLIYEAGLFLAPLPLLVWWARFGWSSGAARLRAQIGPAVIWGSAVAIAAAYVLAMSLSGSNYQMDVTGDHWTMLSDVVARVPLLFTIALYRLFAHGWYDGFRMLLEHLNFWPWLIGATIALISLLLIIPMPPRENPIEWPRTVRIIIAGFAAAILGYLPYLTSYSHLMTPQRTYLYAAIGATIVVAGLMHALAKIRPALAILLGALCLLSGMGSQWEQMAHYTALSNRQRMILAGILEAAPDAALPNSKRLLIIDRSGSTSNTWMLRGLEMRNALTWLYGAEVSPLVCTEPGLLFSSFLTDPSGRPGRCIESAAGWNIGQGLAEPIHPTSSDIRLPIYLANSDAQLLAIEPDGHVVALTPTPVSQPSSSVTGRWQSMLGCWPASACMFQLPDAASSSFHYDFGKYWGLDDPPWGGGWRDEEWNLPSLNPVSWSWMIAPEANLWFKIKPQPGHYYLRMRLYYWISQNAKKSLTISLNGETLEAKPVDDRDLQADFNSSILKPGLNELRLKADQDPQNGLSVAVDWVNIGPADQPRGPD